jgi:hypothetical protein
VADLLGRGLRLDRRLVDQHHRDVVFDGIDAAALVALKRGPVIHELNGRLARGADENFEELGIDRHRVTIRQAGGSGRSGQSGQSGRSLISSEHQTFQIPTPTY